MSVGMLLGGRYELLESLGRGGFGTVWRAHDRTLGRDVAVKLITLDAALPHAREEIAERFEREARGVAALNDPNIVTAHDYGVEGETAYLVMELITGGSLADELVARDKAKLGPLDVDRVVAIGAQIAAGLAAAHAAGLIHRDLKPANIMVVAGSSNVKIVDFGIARVVDKSRITHTGVYLGTLRYTSPEQMGAGTVDPRSDLYSLGCLLFELMTGRSPYNAETPLQWMAAHQYAAPAKLRTYVPTAPSELETLIDQMLAKTPDGRPPSATIVGERLRDIRRSPVAKGDGPDRAPAAEAPAASPPAAQQPIPRPATPRPQYGPPAKARSPISPQAGPYTPQPGYPKPPISPQPAGAQQVPWPYPAHPPNRQPQAPAYPQAYPGYPVGYRPPAPGYRPVPGAWPVRYPAAIPLSPPLTLVNAARLLRLTAGLSAVLLLCFIIAYHRIAVEWNAAYGGITKDAMQPGIGLAIVAVGTVAQAAFALALATWLRRGSSTARVFAWIFIVVNLLCCVGNFTTLQAFTPTSDEMTTNSAAEVTAANTNFGLGYPGWLNSAAMTIAVIGMLTLVIVAIMMSLRPSRDYFRAMSAMRRR